MNDNNADGCAAATTTTTNPRVALLSDESAVTNRTVATTTTSQQLQRAGVLWTLGVQVVSLAVFLNVCYQTCLMLFLTYAMTVDTLFSMYAALISKKFEIQFVGGLIGVPMSLLLIFAVEELLIVTKDVIECIVKPSRVLTRFGFVAGDTSTRYLEYWYYVLTVFDLILFALYSARGINAPSDYLLWCHIFTFIGLLLARLATVYATNMAAVNTQRGKFYHAVLVGVLLVISTMCFVHQGFSEGGTSIGGILTLLLLFICLIVSRYWRPLVEIVARYLEEESVMKFEVAVKVMPILIQCCVAGAIRLSVIGDDKYISTWQRLGAFVVTFLITLLLFHSADRRLRAAEAKQSAALPTSVLLCVTILGLLLLSGANAPYVPFDETGDRPTTLKQKSRYPICDQQFGVNRTAFNITDAALLAKMSYLTPEDVPRAAKFWFPDYNITLCGRHVPPGPQIFALCIKRPSTGLDTVVVSIRGTSSGSDWAQNGYLWNDSIFLGMFIELTPFTIPNTMLKYLVKVLQWVRFGVFGDLTYVHEIEDFVSKYTRPEQSPLIVGHSLGGGMAMYMGGRFAYESVAFSGVGVGYQVNYDLMTVTNVIPRRDPVPTIDRQTGHLQHIRCRKPLSIMGCHFLHNTFRELASSCTDARYIPVNAPKSEPEKDVQFALPLAIIIVIFIVLTAAYKISQTRRAELSQRERAVHRFVSDWVFVDFGSASDDENDDENTNGIVSSTGAPPNSRISTSIVNNSNTGNVDNNDDTTASAGAVDSPKSMGTIQRQESALEQPDEQNES